MGIIAIPFLANNLNPSRRPLPAVALSKRSSLLSFRFEDFVRNFNSTRREILADSVATDDGGNNWKLLLRKGGDSDGRISISIMLVKENAGKFASDETTKFSCIVRDVYGNIAYEEAFVSSENGDLASGGAESMKLFVMNSFMVDSHVLVNGALTIDVVIQVLDYAKAERTRSSNPLTRNMLRLLESGDRADVMFKVGGATMLAHRFLLEVNAPALARLCDGDDDRMARPVRIHGATPEAFGRVLHYIYGGEAPPISDILRLGKDLITLARRFGAAGLKAEAERSLIEGGAVDASNCIDYLLFASEEDCPALKKHAIRYILGRSGDVLASESSERLKDRPELMHEVMLAMACGSKREALSGPVRKKLVRGQWRSQQVANNAVFKANWPQHEMTNDGGGQVPAVVSVARSPHAGAGTELDADKVRSDAKRILQAADKSMKNCAKSRLLRISDIDGWMTNSRRSRNPYS